MKKISVKIGLLFTFLATVTLAGTSDDVTPDATQVALAAISVTDAFVRVPIAGQKNTAAFMTLHNSADHAHKLVAVKTSLAESAELHSHTMSDGMMRMRQQDSIVIDARGHTILEPGGLHIMLLSLQQTIRTGDSVEFVLVFEDGSRLPVRLAVKSLFDNNHQHHHHH